VFLNRKSSSAPTGMSISRSTRFGQRVPDRINPEMPMATGSANDPATTATIIGSTLDSKRTGPVCSFMPGQLPARRSGDPATQSVFQSRPGNDLGSENWFTTCALTMLDDRSTHAERKNALRECRKRSRAATASDQSGGCGISAAAAGPWVVQARDSSIHAHTDRSRSGRCADGPSLPARLGQTRAFHSKGSGGDRAWTAAAR